MITLRATQLIHAPIERCFDLTRSVEVHLETSKNIQGRVEAGKLSGLSALHDETLWSARYFGLRFYTRLRVDLFDAPRLYGERNVGGPFHLFQHRYTLKPLADGNTELTDTLCIESPLHPLTHPLDRFLLAPRLQTEMSHRLRRIQQLAEQTSSV